MDERIPESGCGCKDQAGLPPIGETVLVQGEGFRCLAYRDKDGKWKDYFHGTELRGSVRVLKAE